MFQNDLFVFLRKRIFLLRIILILISPFLFLSLSLSGERLSPFHKNLFWGDVIFDSTQSSSGRFSIYLKIDDTHKSFFSSDNLNYCVIFYCCCFEFFNVKSGVLPRRDLHVRESNRTLWTLHIRTTVARIRHDPPPRRVPSLFIHTLWIKHDGDWPTRACARVKFCMMKMKSDNS